MPISAQTRMCRRRGFSDFTAAHIDASLRSHPDRLRMRVGGVFVDTPLDFVAEMTQQALHRPCGAVAERADRVPFDLLAHFHPPLHPPLSGSPPPHPRMHTPP